MNTTTPETFDFDQFQEEVMQGIDYLETSQQHSIRISLMSSARELEDTEDYVVNLSWSERQAILKELRNEMRGKLFIFNTSRLLELLDKLEATDQEIREKTRRQLDRIGRQFGSMSEEVIERQDHLEAEKNKLQTEAAKVIANRSVLRRICAALRTASSDSHDIAKVIVPIMIPLALAGTLPIPVQPLIFSYLAILISRMGIESLCADYQKKT